jgi:hypothetical protein
MTTSDKIRRLLAKGLNVAAVAKKLNVKPGRVYTVKYLDKKKAQAQPERSHDPKVVKAEKKYIRKIASGKPSRIIEAVKEMKQALDVIENKRIMINLARRKDGAIIDLNKGGEVISSSDPINSPPHYKSGGIETIDFIEAKDLNYRLGNVIKYVSRAGKKGDPIQDLEKAAWYLQREITARKNA